MAYFALHLQASGLAEHEQDLFAGSLSLTALFTAKKNHQVLT